jgi:hypothetical protein
VCPLGFGLALALYDHAFLLLRSLARALLDISASVVLPRIITIRVSSFCLQ